MYIKKKAERTADMGKKTTRKTSRWKKLLFQLLQRNMKSILLVNLAAQYRLWILLSVGGT